MKKTHFLKFLFVLAISFNSVLESSRADETKLTVESFSQARELFQDAVVPHDPKALALGKRWVCVLTQFEGNHVYSTTDELKFEPVGKGSTMLVNDVFAGNREFVGSVWVDSGFGYESSDSNNFNCFPGAIKTADYYKRVLRVAKDGRVIIERMTNENGGCIAKTDDQSGNPRDEMEHPEAISDRFYRARQYIVCSLAEK